MADLDQIERALRAADAAGNTEDARRLAQAYAEARQSQAPVQAEPPAQAKPNAFVDSVRSIPGGLAKGAAALVGLPGDVNSMLDSGANWAMSKMTGKPVDISTNSFPTSEGINKAVSAPFGGYYEPKTTDGQYTETVASFLPAAIAPGSVVARAARVIAPAVASETAGQATKGTPYEPYARAGGALLGGVAIGGIEGALNSRKSKPPTMEELGALKNAAYKAAEDAGVVIRPDAFKAFADDLADDLAKNYVVQPKLHENAVAALKVIQDEAKAGVPISLERADSVRQVVNNAIEAGGKNNGGDARIAGKIKESLDRFLDDLPASDLVAGDASVAVPILKDARALAAREFKAKEIQKLIDLAENQASANYSAAGVETALRQQFKAFNAKLIKDPMLAKTFTKAERDAVSRVAKGGPVGNALRYFGKWAPTGPMSTGLASGVGGGAGALVGSALAGPGGAAAGAALGASGAATIGGLSRLGATASTRRNALQALEVTMRGSPIPANSAANPLLVDAVLGFQGAR